MVWLPHTLLAPTPLYSLSSFSGFCKPPLAPLLLFISACLLSALLSLPTSVNKYFSSSLESLQRETKAQSSPAVLHLVNLDWNQVWTRWDSSLAVSPLMFLTAWPGRDGLSVASWCYV